MTQREDAVPSTEEDSSPDNTLAKDEFLNSTHNVIPQKGRGVQVNLFTDGAAKGYLQSHDRRGFAGWGVFIEGVSRTRTTGWTRYGGMPNANSTEAEFFALLQGLKEITFKSNVLVITDCSHLVYALSKREHALARLEEIETMPHGDRQRDDWMELAPLKVFKRITDAMDTMENLLSLDVQWVRAHTIDDNEEESSNPQIRQWAIGNQKADEQATEGAKKAIRNALWNFRHHKDNAAAFERHLAVCRKNFMYSRFARDVAIEFLTDRPGFIAEQIVEDILPGEDAASILAGWAS